MAEPEDEIFYVVAESVDPAADRPGAAPQGRAFALTPSSADEAPPAVAAEVHRPRIEIFPTPDGDTDRIEWVDSPPTALVNRSEMQALGEGLWLADRDGALFRALRVEQLPAVPQGRLDMLHGEPGAAATFDIVMLSEGYAAADRDAFLDAARRLYLGFLNIRPYGDCRDGIRIAALHLPSPETGITETRCDAEGDGQHGEDPCRASGQRRNTLFGTSNLVLDVCRRICGSETRVRGVLAANHVRALLDAQGIQPRLAVVVVNTRVYGGAGAAAMNLTPLVVWAAPNGSGPAVMAHEVGHALGLQDEYDYNDGSHLPGPEHWVNISDEADPARTPWHCLANDLAAQHPSCTHHDENCSCAATTVGTFEGAGYKKLGRYRPAKNCGMRTTGLPFCLVCRTQITNRLTGVAGKICPPN